MTQSQVTEALEIATGNQALSLTRHNKKMATRNDVIFTVWKLAGSPRVDQQIDLTNIQLNDDSYPAWQYAVQHGWTDGWITENRLNPNKPILRKEFATLVDKALNPFENLPVSIVPDGYSKN
ncbi:MAG: hypothetical protein U5K72_13360 [Balneolaceae bacterium]|nr:hypothetical protein [Balneolaceae bacterium]